MFKHNNVKHVTVLKPGHPPCSCGKYECDMRKKGATRGHSTKEPVLSDYTAAPYLKLLRTYSMLDLISWEDAAKLEVRKIELEKK